MSELAAHLVDRVIPDVPVRQWVLSRPWSLRDQLAFDAALCRDGLAVFIRVVFGWLRRTAVRAGVGEGPCGAVTVIQRLGSALNVHVPRHSLVLDGVFTRPTPTAAPVFHPLPAPTDEELAQIVEPVHPRVRSLRRRRGRMPEAPSPTDPVAEPMRLLAGSTSASIQARVARGPRAGHPVRRLRSAAAVVDTPRPRCARLEGFSLHATVALPAHAREALEHVCRDLLRPPLALERVTERPHGPLVDERPHPRRDGSTPRWLDPLALIEKMAVLVPAPRVHVLRCHGVLAPPAAWRSPSVPGPPDAVEHDAGAGGPSDGPVAGVGSPPPSRSAGRSWSALLNRVFAIDVCLCPRCGGRRRIVAVYPGGAGLRSRLERLGLPEARAAPRSSRAPPGSAR